MKRFHTLFVLMIAASLGAVAQQTPSAQPAPAAQTTNDTSALEQKVRDLEDRLVLLEGEIRQMKAHGTQPPAAGAPATPEQGTAPATTTVQMHESEIGLQAIIDPYARGDFFISFGETGVNLEEGFITFTALPAGFVVKGGKMRAAFGKVNSLHNHVLPWVDRPLVTQNLVGGEDGIDDAGFSVQHIIPAPKNWFLEFTGQTFRGDSSDVFTSSVKNDVSVVGHLRGYRDLTENSNLDFGVSYSRGHNLFGTDFVTHLYGVDAMYRWKPVRRAIYKAFSLRSEFIWRQQNQPSLVACATITCPANTLAGFQRAFGFYTSADYQFARRWFVGARVDDSDRPFNSRLNDKGGSLVLTYWPSEFAQIRGQYRLTRYA